MLVCLSVETDMFKAFPYNGLANIITLNYDCKVLISLFNKVLAQLQLPKMIQYGDKSTLSYLVSNVETTLVNVTLNM